LNAANVTRLHPENPPTLLVVEDDVVTRFMIADELRLSGFKVLEASTAEDAITVLETVPVHLVFTDIHIPGQRSGRDVAEFARQVRPPPHIVLTSGKVRPEDMPGLQELGPFVQKPYLLSRVVELVHRMLDPTGERS
jgi:CheY-like chemotaxis protein